LYTKGQHLLGLYEGRDLLAAGADPALVEGPLDAVALTLAGDGHTVGVATLGTALTDRQADLLRPYIRPDGPGILIATDNDPAGQRAAERIYRQLTARGDDPRRLALPTGLDPADLHHDGGAPALREAIARAGNLADQVLDAGIARAVPSGNTADVTQAVREAAAIIAALPPPRWLSHIDRVTDALHLPPGTVHQAVLDAGHTSRPAPVRSSPTEAGHRRHQERSPATPDDRPPIALPLAAARTMGARAPDTSAPAL
ncbi:MAG: toprim domain-containing protein, partial [Actinomycetota bacterium]|nr:toprim domain-containing protein [Actinomycetota bacterium]